VQRNMPQNHPGTLTPQEAHDVSAYVASRPHSRFQPDPPSISAGLN